MRIRLHWTAVSIFALALIVSAGCLTLPAQETSQKSDAKTFIAQHKICAGVMIAEAAQSGKREPEKSEAVPGVVKKEKKDAATPEAPDEVQALKARIIDLQNKGKLGFRKIVRCSSVEGFGRYSPLEPGQPVSKIIYYCEPSNVSTMISGDRYVIDCTVDAFLMNQSGRVLLGRPNMFRIDRVSRSPVMDLYFKIEINARKLPVGKMMVKIVLHDKIKNQSVTTVHRMTVNRGSKKELGNI